MQPTAVPERETVASGTVAAGTGEMQRLFALQREAFARDRSPDLATRRGRLARIARLVSSHEHEIVEAISADFGHRSGHETRLAECYIVEAAARHALRRLPRWMKRSRVPTPWHFLPARSYVMRQPVGVVGIISPWNYPLQLALAPVVGALAAGNRVLLKPSELTPRVAALLARLVASEFHESEFAVVAGDTAVGQAFSSLPFDHLLFTGSTAVGRHVARAAAENLTPVTLELGGKSPAFFEPGADFSRFAQRLVVGKLLNAGQTCIAPDYALVPAAGEAAFVAAVERAVARLYPTLDDDYTTIVNARHVERLQALVEDARAQGARILSLGSAGASPRLRRFPPTLIVGVDDRMAVMREEIFGPLLPVETYDSIEGAIARINARPHPLAFYYFGDDASVRERVLAQTLAGGVTINDTVWHFAHEDLPFGGVGASDIGAYHGERGFLTFSHEKGVFVQSRWAATALLAPPYGKMFEVVFALLKKLNT